MSGQLTLDATPDTLFADVVLPVPVGKFFTYRVPRALGDLIKPGLRVIVPFGQKKVLTGIVVRLHTQPPRDYEAKYILELLDSEEVIYAAQFSLYQWMADYYMCTLGEVVQAALPAGLKLSSESAVQLHPGLQPDDLPPTSFSDKEWLLIRALQKQTLSYSEAAKVLQVKSIYSLLKSLSAKNAIILLEEVKEKYKPKTERRVQLARPYLNKKNLEKLFLELEGKPKQEAVILKYLQLVPVLQHPELNARGLNKRALLSEDVSESSLATLIKNGVVNEFDQLVPRFDSSEERQPQPPVLLSEHQQVAQQQIMEGFEQNRPVLLHGITGSGKTEIYVSLVRKALQGGAQVLYLLPEIALTTQIVERLKKIFGNDMGVYHSKFSDNERVEVWNGVRQGKLSFVVGVRSSVFLPFDNLGLIIVDEEHDGSYKQHDPAPRYQARDVALYMGRLHSAKVLLGSATPSVESFFHAKTGKYRLVSLRQRFGSAQLPTIQLANSSQGKKQKTNKGEFTGQLLAAIASALEQKEQTILFQNRRGYAPLVQCQDCGWVPTCIHCAVSLTYHQYRHALVCHYCGYKEELPAQCPQCSSKRLITMGYGTEKLEEELKLLFPHAKTERMDWDSTRTKSGYENIITHFEEGQTDILVGTQMVTKGLDFERVSLVGIFDADRMMHFPDFRSYERAFQLMMQVSGRAGRRQKKGNVIIQTANPAHRLFDFVKQNDVAGFIAQELPDRELHLYPPYARLIDIRVKHPDKALVRKLAQALADHIAQSKLPLKMMGPGEPVIGKIRNEFLMSLLLKIPRQQTPLQPIKEQLLAMATALLTDKNFRRGKIIFDVDPN